MISVRTRLLATTVAVTSLLAGGSLAFGSPAVARSAGSKSSSHTRCGSHPWCNTELSAAKRAHLLLAAMSQADKVGLLQGNGSPDVGMPAVTATDGAVGPGGIGSGSAKASAMPASIALAAGFDKKMANTYGKTVGRGVRHRGFDADYGPTINLMRTPLGGRTFEAYGEDPYLAGQMAVGWVRGFQSEGVMADPKHFVANDQEGQLGVSPGTGVIGGRFIVNAVVDERTLHEVYLRPFEAAVKQGHAASVMCSYNQVNGVYSCANKLTLTNVLRKQWGFKGFVFSDAGACHEPNQDIAAGMNIDILGTCYTSPEVDAELAAGVITEKQLDAITFNTLRALFIWGFFDHPTWPKDINLDNVKADAAVADQTDERGTVLLRNRGVLPLRRKLDKKIAVIGPAANQYILGAGSSQVKPWFTTTALQGIQARAKQAGDTVTYDDGSNPVAAAALAKKSDIVIVVAADSESEGVDKLCMSLRATCTGGQQTPPAPLASQAAFGNQDALIEQVAAANQRTVVVLETGAPVLTPWRHSVAAILEAWYPGEDGGTAIARVLYGDVDPGGRLPATFPRSPGQLPTAGSTAQYPGTVNPKSPAFLAAHYSEGVMVGYRWYDEHHLKPAYPFGFGLSYTKFKYSHFRGTAGGKAHFNVTNVGHRAGWAVPQVYVSVEPRPHVPEPPQTLAGFAKVYLQPGQTRHVAVPIDERAYQYWDVRRHRFRDVPLGCQETNVATSSRHHVFGVALCASHG
ncbi:MAG TPA: glycoside hydrolase family 3 C-terminal domain-containing protein [Mycobacteriales bacterium]|nr:glycoside hydrolase family 3 C-terminal domain-containing protein [Mycobacteriales bacterium]